LILLVEEQTL